MIRVARRLIKSPVVLVSAAIVLLNLNLQAPPQFLKRPNDFPRCHWLEVFSRCLASQAQPNGTLATFPCRPRQPSRVGHLNVHESCSPSRSFSRRASGSSPGHACTGFRGGAGLAAEPNRAGEGHTHQLVRREDSEDMELEDQQLLSRERTGSGHGFELTPAFMFPRTEAANWTAKLPYPWKRAIDHSKQIYYFHNPETGESRFTFPPAVAKMRYPNETRVQHDIPSYSQFFFLTGVTRPEIKRDTKFYFGANRSVVYRIYGVEEIGWGHDTMKRIVFQPDTDYPIKVDTKLTLTNATDEKDIRDERKKRILASLDSLSVESIAGNGLMGNADSSTMANASFFRPCAVAYLDVFETFIVADSGNHAIRRASFHTRGVATVSGFNATMGYIDGHTEHSKFNTPRGVECDGQGNIYVADTSNDVIRKIDIFTSTVTTWAGQRRPKSLSTHADGVGTVAIFSRPHEIRFGPDGNLYVADKLNNRIRKIEPNANVTTVVGTGELGFADGRGSEMGFIDVETLGIDIKGNLYASTSFGDNRVRMVTPGGEVTTYCGKAEPGESDGSFETAEFEMIRSIDVDGDSNVFVSEGIANRIRRISPAREVVTYAGDGYVIGGWRDGGAAQARFDQQYGICVDNYGRVAVADTGNNKIRLVSFPWQRNLDFTREGKGIYRQKGEGELTLANDVDDERLSNSLQFLTPSKRQSIGFVRPGAMVYYMGDHDDRFEIVEVLDIDHKRMTDIIQIRHCDGGDQLVHIDYLRECPEDELHIQHTKDADRIESNWHGAFPTPKPTALEVVSDGHLENIPYDYLYNGQFMMSSKPGKAGSVAPAWGNPLGSYKGKQYDGFGNELLDPMGVPKEERVLDPAKVYLYGTKDYPGPDRSFKEKQDVFEYEHRPLKTPIGVFHTNELEIDPDQYADWVEEDKRRFPRTTAPLYEAAMFLDEPIRPPSEPDFKKLRRMYEPLMDEQTLLSSRNEPDLAPRNPLLENIWHKDVGPPPEVAARIEEEKRLEEERKQSHDTPTLSNMPVMTHLPIYKKNRYSFKMNDKLGYDVVDKRG